MALTPEPPPYYPYPPSGGTRWPQQDPTPPGGQWIQTSVYGPGFDILGRDGNPAPDGIIDIITTIFWNWPYQDPNGSWCGMLGGEYLGRGGGRWKHGAIILFELRTAAEVAAVAADSVDEAFAVTLFGAGLEGGGSVPPADGAAYFNGDPYNPDDWPDQRFHRILIREDLFSGGAGAQWAGRDFFAETCLHEMGHIAQNYLIELYGEDYVKVNTCAMFGQPVEKWNNHSDPWQARVIEAGAEAYKDICLPTRQYDNRTNYALPHTAFHDFLKLYVDYFENPFWDYNNTAKVFYQYSFSFSAVVGGSQPAWLFIPDYHIPRTGVSPSVWNNVLAWPKVGDTLRLHWNLLADDDLDWGDNFLPTSAEDAAQLFAKAKIGITYWKIGYWGHFSWEFDPDWFIRTDEVELNPVRNNASGVIELDTSSLPPEGFVAELAFPGSGPWEYPRFDSPPHIDYAQLGGTVAIGFPSANPVGNPWEEHVGGIKRTRYLIRDITWPYEATTETDRTSELTVADGVAGVVRL